MSTNFNRIIFDYDGTLVIHDKENEGRQIAEILNIPEEKIPEFSRRLEHLFKTSYGRCYYKDRKMTYELYCYILNCIMRPLREFGISATDFDRAINKKSKYMSKLAPHAEEILTYLKEKGYELCILTNGFYTSQVDNMKHHGIYNYFDRVYAWDNYYPKPNRRALYSALGGTDPKNNVMIGDNIINDIIPAKINGVFNVGINIPKEDMSLIKPDVVITDLIELKRIL